MGTRGKMSSMFSRYPARPIQREDAPKRSETRRRLRDHVTPLANRAARPLDIQSRLSIERGCMCSRCAIAWQAITEVVEARVNPTVVALTYSKVQKHETNRIA